MSDKLTKLLATFFYIGDVPVAPGTLASLVGLLIYIVLYEQKIVFIVLMFAVLIAGFLVSGRMEKIVKQKDPSCIVIDEVAGSMIAFCFLPITVPVLFTAFFLFRAFDMFKIYPMNTLENRPGALGVMMDDVVAGLYTNITMQVAIRLVGMVK